MIQYNEVDNAETVRSIIREHLISKVPSVKGNVWEPNNNPKPKFPLINIVQDAKPDTLDSQYISEVYYFTLWLSVKPETFKAIDVLEKEVKQAIHDTVIMVDNVPHYIQVNGSSVEDLYLEDWKAYSRNITLVVHGLDWMKERTMSPDPIRTIINHSYQVFQDNIQLDPKLWDPREIDKPALYWRQSSITMDEPMSWGGWYTATLHGHVICPDVDNRKLLVDNIVREFTHTNRAYMEDDSPMFFNSIESDYGYDPFGRGQVTMEIRFGILKDRPRRYIDNIYINDSDIIIDAIEGGELDND